jgi:hypothetical protein
MAFVSHGLALLCSVLIDDPKAKDRSLMLKKPSICNGQATGHPCKHYWFHTQKVESNDPDALKDGEKHRACLISPGFPVEFSDEEIPHVCNQYEPRRKRGLAGFFGAKVPYDPSQEEYNPLTPEEIAALRSQDSTPLPERGFFTQTAGFDALPKGSLPIIQGDVDAAEVASFLATIGKKDEDSDD